jgi:outer membrane protein W
MKKTSFILILIFCFFTGFSQTEKPLYPFDKGKFSFSTSFNGGFAFTHLSMYSLNNTFGYFPVKNLLFGFSTTQSFGGNLKNTYFLNSSIGVFGKYYVGNRRIKPYISAGYQFNSYFTGDENQNGFSIPLSLGIDFAINSKISLDFGITKNFLFKTPVNNLSFTPMIGIRFRF